ncbi:unnamed protein product [Caenorhabditis sp. 36 PRJEB53466]|nr:unnamed protein product [Caenorhabditis sp. 36 PRJEB53466]
MDGSTASVSTSTSPFACKVCNHKAHGNHFGVISCRACAAFFRRTAGSKWSKLPCRGGSCDRETFFCKPCRLQRCRDMGMDTTKFQYNRDGILVSGQFRLPQSLENYVGRPEFLLFCGSESPDSKVRVDVRHLLEEATRILNSGAHSPLNTENPNQLRKLNNGFNFIKLDMENIQAVGYAGREEVFAMWEYYFITVTKWLMYFDEFQKLNRHLQMTLLQSIWHVWSKLHKHVSTAMFRKVNKRAKKSEVIIKNMYMDMEKTKMDLRWMSDYPSEQVHKFMAAQNCSEFDTTEHILAIDPTDTELTYMFAQLCFEYAGKRYQGDIMKVTDQFQKILANDLHDYYVNELNRPRYFYRLAKLMQVNNAIQRMIWESRPKQELGRVFNVIKLEFSHPEMFKDSGFL